jgi:hypothetical protein
VEHHAGILLRYIRSLTEESDCHCHQNYLFKAAI